MQASGSTCERVCTLFNAVYAIVWWRSQTYWLSYSRAYYSRARPGPPPSPERPQRSHPATRPLLFTARINSPIIIKCSWVSYSSQGVISNLNRRTSKILHTRNRVGTRQRPEVCYGPKAEVSRPPYCIPPLLIRKTALLLILLTFGLVRVSTYCI